MSTPDDMVNQQIVMRPVAAIKEYEGNARHHSEAQVLQIASSIQRFGFIGALVIDQDDVIIAGHGRLRAARYLGMVEVPCYVVSHLSKRERDAYVIVDNKLAENATWDFQKLSDEVSRLVQQDFDVELLGFDEQFLDALLKEDMDILPTAGQSAVTTVHVSEHERVIKNAPEPDFDDKGVGYKRQYGVIVTCSGEDEQREIFERLTSEGMVCKIVVT